MSDYVFKQYNFDSIPNLTLYNALKLRSDVFVVEQNCVYPDLDNKDISQNAIHIIGEMPTIEHQLGTVVAYARCLAPGVSFPEASIGRVAVAQSMRGKGLARDLMQVAIQTCYQQWPEHPIQIGAQVYLQDFYTSLGFVINSAPYDEDGIMHVDMTLTNPSSLAG